MLAAASGVISLVRTLLEMGADASVCDHKGASPLVLAAFKVTDITTPSTQPTQISSLPCKPEKTPKRTRKEPEKNPKRKNPAKEN
jgi:hypothetical protein